MLRLGVLVRRILIFLLVLGQLFLPVSGFAGVPIVFDYSNVKDLLGYMPSSYLSGIKVADDYVKFAWRSFNGQGRAVKLSEKEREANIKFFLVALSVPENQLWVNLNVFLNELEVLGRKLLYTDIGKVLMYSDVKLKEDVKNLLISEGIWDELMDYAQSLSVEKQSWEFNPRFWIVPGEIQAFLTKGGIFIKSARLNVMFQLKSSTVANHSNIDGFQQKFEDYANRLIKEKLIPILEKMVNSQSKYTLLRQVYYACILAQWYKKFEKDKIDFVFSQIADSGMLGGLLSDKLWSPRSFLDQYVRMYKQDLWDSWGDDWQFYGGGVVLYGALDKLHILKEFSSQELQEKIKAGEVRIEVAKISPQKTADSKKTRRFLGSKSLWTALAFLGGIGLLSVAAPSWAFDIQTAVLELVKAASQHNLAWAFVADPQSLGLWVVDLHNRGIPQLVDKIYWIINSAGYSIDKTELTNLIVRSVHKTIKAGMHLYYLSPDLLSNIANQTIMVGGDWTTKITVKELVSKFLNSSAVVQEQAFNFLSTAGLIPASPTMDKVFSFLSSYRWSIVGLIGGLYGLKRIYNGFKGKKITTKVNKKVLSLLFIFGISSLMMALLMPNSIYAITNGASDLSAQYHKLISLLGSQISVNLSQTGGLKLVVPEGLVSSAGSVNNFVYQLLSQIFKDTGISVKQLLELAQVNIESGNVVITIGSEAFGSLGLDPSAIKNIITQVLARAVISRISEAGSLGQVSVGVSGMDVKLNSVLLGISALLFAGESMKKFYSSLRNKELHNRLAQQGFGLFGEETTEIESNPELEREAIEIYNSIVTAFAENNKTAIINFIKSDSTVRGEAGKEIFQLVEDIFGSEVTAEEKAILLADLLAAKGIMQTGRVGVEGAERDDIRLFVLIAAKKLKDGEFDDRIDAMMQLRDKVYKADIAPDDLQKGGIVFSDLKFSSANTF